MNSKTSRLCARYAAALGDQGFPVKVETVKRTWKETPKAERRAMSKNMKSVVDGRKISPEVRQRLEVAAFEKKKQAAKKDRDQVQRVVIAERLRMARRQTAGSN